MSKYVVNNQLTPDALLTTDLIKRCTFNVGSAIPVKLRDDESVPKKPVLHQYYQKFVEITYPGGDKSASMIIPNCVMHNQIHDYFGKPSIYVGIPKTWVREIALKLSTTGNAPIFEDKKILSSDVYFWTRASMHNAEDSKEFIRMFDGEGEDFFGGFADLFQEFPTSMVANITCSLKLKAETLIGEPLTGREEWRAGFTFSMFAPFDAIEVPAPSTGIGQKSMSGKADIVKPGLARFKKRT